MNIYCYKRVSVELARWYPHAGSEEPPTKIDLVL